MDTGFVLLLPNTHTTTTATFIEWPLFQDNLDKLAPER